MGFPGPTREPLTPPSRPCGPSRIDQLMDGGWVYATSDVTCTPQTASQPNLGGSSPFGGPVTSEGSSPDIRSGFLQLSAPHNRTAPTCRCRPSASSRSSNNIYRPHPLRLFLSTFHLQTSSHSYLSFTFVPYIAHTPK